MTFGVWECQLEALWCSEEVVEATYQVGVPWPA